jgi:hypothetical protein
MRMAGWLAAGGRERLDERRLAAHGGAARSRGSRWHHPRGRGAAGTTIFNSRSFPAVARSDKTNDRAVFVSWLLQRLVLYSYMMYLETIFRTCTRISRERGKFVRGMIVLDLTGAATKSPLETPVSYQQDHLP